MATALTHTLMSNGLVSLGNAATSAGLTSSSSSFSDYYGSQLQQISTGMVLYGNYGNSTTFGYDPMPVEPDTSKIVEKFRKRFQETTEPLRLMKEKVFHV